MYANETEYYEKMETLHKSEALKAKFHQLIAATTLWRFCVFCGEPIKREDPIIDINNAITGKGTLSE